MSHHPTNLPNQSYHPSVLSVPGFLLSPSKRTIVNNHTGIVINHNNHVGENNNNSSNTPWDLFTTDQIHVPLPCLSTSATPLPQHRLPTLLSTSSRSSNFLGDTTIIANSHEVGPQPRNIQTTTSNTHLNHSTNSIITEIPPNLPNTKGKHNNRNNSSIFSFHNDFDQHTPTFPLNQQLYHAQTPNHNSHHHIDENNVSMNSNNQTNVLDNAFFTAPHPYPIDILSMSNCSSFSFHQPEQELRPIASTPVTYSHTTNASVTSQHPVFNPHTTPTPSHHHNPTHTAVNGFPVLISSNSNHTHIPHFPSHYGGSDTNNTSSVFSHSHHHHHNHHQNNLYELENPLSTSASQQPKFTSHIPSDHQQQQFTQDPTLFPNNLSMCPSIGENDILNRSFANNTQSAENHISHLPHHNSSHNTSHYNVTHAATPHNTSSATPHIASSALPPLSTSFSSLSHHSNLSHIPTFHNQLSCSSASALDRSFHENNNASSSNSHHHHYFHNTFISTPSSNAHDIYNLGQISIIVQQQQQQQQQQLNDCNNRSNLDDLLSLASSTVISDYYQHNSITHYTFDPQDQQTHDNLNPGKSKNLNKRRNSFIFNDQSPDHQIDNQNVSDNTPNKTPQKPKKSEKEEKKDPASQRRRSFASLLAPNVITTTTPTSASAIINSTLPSSTLSYASIVTSNPSIHDSSVQTIATATTSSPPTSAKTTPLTDFSQFPSLIIPSSQPFYARLMKDVEKNPLTSIELLTLITCILGDYIIAQRKEKENNNHNNQEKPKMGVSLRQLGRDVRKYLTSEQLEAFFQQRHIKGGLKTFAMQYPHLFNLKNADQSNSILSLVSPVTEIILLTQIIHTIKTYNYDGVTMMNNPNENTDDKKILPTKRLIDLRQLSTILADNPSIDQIMFSIFKVKHNGMRSFLLNYPQLFTLIGAQERNPLVDANYFLADYQFADKVPKVVPLKYYPLIPNNTNKSSPQPSQNNKDKKQH